MLVLYTLFIPVIHYIARKLKLAGSTMTDIAFPLAFLAITLREALELRDRVRGITLSTIPVLGNLHLPVILVLDKLSVVMLVATGVFYTYLVVCWLKKANRRDEVLLTITALTVNCLLLDLLLSTVMLSIILAYLALVEDERFYADTLFVHILFFTLGYALTNTVNLGLLPFLARSGQVPVKYAELGTYIYVVAYTLVLFTALGVKPVLNTEREFNAVSETVLTLYAVPVILRLLPVLYDISHSTLYAVYAYSTLFFATLTNLHYAFKYLKVGELKYLLAFDSSYIVFALSLQPPLTVHAGLIALLTVFLHKLSYSILEQHKVRGFKENLVLSSTGAFPYPGFIARATTLAYLFSSYGIAFAILPLITTVFAAFTRSLACFTSVWKPPSKFSLLLVVVAVLVAVSSDYLIKASLEVSNARLYTSVVFGV